MLKCLQYKKQSLNSESLTGVTCREGVLCAVYPPLHAWRDGQPGVVSVEGRGAGQQDVADHSQGPDVTRLPVPAKQHRHTWGWGGAKYS